MDRIEEIDHSQQHMSGLTMTVIPSDWYSNYFELFKLYYCL